MRPGSLIRPALLSRYSSLFVLLVWATALAAGPPPTDRAETTPSEVVLPETTVASEANLSLGVFPGAPLTAIGTLRVEF